MAFPRASFHFDPALKSFVPVQTDAAHQPQGRPGSAPPPAALDFVRGAKAPALGIDPLGYGFTPFAYAAGQVLAQAVEATKSLDHARPADHIHASKFTTVAPEHKTGNIIYRYQRAKGR